MDILRITEDSELCKRLIGDGNLEIEQFRICRFSKLIANYVVTEGGLLDLARIKEVTENFQIVAYGGFDVLYPSHVKQILKIVTQKRIILKLRQLSLPLANKWVENLIYPSNQNPTKKGIVVAILEALLIFLRQTVGSCFATAPIILVQTNNPEFLFDDLYDLITRGFLKRVMEGIEYKVPISIKSSFRIDYESPLMKCYEYTVASFADWKIEFYKWNMYAGLGLDTKDISGIGEVVFSHLRERLNLANQAVQISHEELFHAENRYKRSGERIEEQRIILLRLIFEEKSEIAERIAKFYPLFIEQLLKLFPKHFQEVFDPEMAKEGGEILEDRPAGFRLMFKHGRSDPAVWTMIYDQKGYLKSLEEFFRLIEPDIAYAFEWQGSKIFIQEIIDKIIQTIWEPSFFQNATIRVKQMRSQQKSDIGSISPWAYISGGNLESLAIIYFSLKNPLQKREFFPESALDLCVYLIEFMKDLHYVEAKEFESSPLQGILMTNQVHAFVFKPGLKSFLPAWQDNGNTHTYIRDHKECIEFADTNWASEYFVFAHNPKTKKLELCRKSTFSLKSLPDSWSNYFSRNSPWTLWLPKNTLQIDKF